MTSRPPVLCLSCTRLRHDPPEPQIPGSLPRVVACQAFPAGIPRAIALYGADHRTALGDEVDGLIYEQAPGEAAAALFESWRRTFAPSAQELAARRIVMDSPVTFTRPPDAAV